MTYQKRMEDAFGDVFVVKAQDGQVLIHDANKYADPPVADLAFTPPEALKLARQLIKAAATAYDQEADACP